MKPEEIKQARQQLKCTAKELAAALEIDAKTVMAWELGDAFPTKKFCDQIEQFLKDGPSAIPRKAKGSDPLASLRDPDVWVLIRKILIHAKLRAEVAKIAAKYDEPE